MKKINIAIIGLRHLHPRSYMTHFKMIDEVDVIAVAEDNESIRSQFVKDFDIHGYSHWTELFEKEPIDLAAIFLPHIQCPDAALDAIDRGINVMIEKPMTVDSASAQKIVDQAGKRNMMVTTPYVWRYHPVVKDIKQILETGFLGQVIGCTGRCAAGRLQRYIDGNAEWMLDAKQSGGGPMYNLGVHWIDLFNWLLGSSAKSAFGTNVKVNQSYNIEDNSSAILMYENGTVLNLDISYTVPEAYPHGRDLFIGIRGTRGVINWSPAYEGEKDELFICSDHDSFKGAPIQRRSYELTPVAGYSGIMGLHYLKDVAQAIRDGKPAPISGEDGVSVLRIVEAIYKSAEKKSIINIEDV
jgi:myo-inositol 2-dehydrogenase/D-chiro-inositol 1-dehydrogenase